MNTRRKRRAVATMALAAPLAGCGSEDRDNGTNAEPRAQRATSATPRLVGDYPRALTEADVRRTEKVRRAAGPNQGRPEPGPLELRLSDGTLKLVDLGADVTILQDFSATSDSAFRIGAYQRHVRVEARGRCPDPEGTEGPLRRPRLGPRRRLETALTCLQHRERRPPCRRNERSSRGRKRAAGPSPAATPQPRRSTMRRARIATSLLALLASIAAGPIATATAASERVDHFRVTDGPSTNAFEPCGAIETVTVTVHGADYYDAGGGWVRSLVHFAYDSVVAGPPAGRSRWTRTRTRSSRRRASTR